MDPNGGRASFLANYGLVPLTQALAQFWTLSLEEQFYFVWPSVLSRFDLRTVKRIAIAAIVVSPVIRVGWYFLTRDAGAAMMFHTRLDAMMFGAIPALCWRDGGFQRLVDHLDRWKATPAAIVYAFVASPYLSYFGRGAYSLPFDLTLTGVCGAIILMRGLRYPKGALANFLGHPWLVHVGKISYSLYLWNSLFCNSTNRTWTGWFPLNLVCSFVAAEVSYRLVEKRFLALKERFASEPPSAGERREAA